MPHGGSRVMGRVLNPSFSSGPAAGHPSGHGPSRPPEHRTPSGPTGPAGRAAESLLQAQPRLFIFLGIVPPAAATAWWKLTGSTGGFAVAVVLLIAGALFLFAHRSLKRMTAVHWGIAAGVAFIAAQINGGKLGTPAALSFVSLLAVVFLALKLPARIRLQAGLMAALVWLGTAGASTMVSTHDQAQASLADMTVTLLGWLRDWLAGLGGGIG